MSARGELGRRYVEVGASRPIPRTVDWANEPSTFKLYPHAPRIRLDAAPGMLGRLGQLLRDVNGLSRQRWHAPDGVRTGRPRRRPGSVTTPVTAPVALRPVPAGGARYPCELYLVAGEDQPVRAGVAHYDPAHHGLDVLDDRPGPPGLRLALTVAFWKNVFKYGEFSYRLHSLDAGVVLGQVLVVAAGHGFLPRVRFRFPDAGWDTLLDLDPAEESVYAVVELVAPGGPVPGPIPDLTAPATGIGTGATGARAAHPRSLAAHPLPAALHAACLRPDDRPWPDPSAVPEVLAAAPAALGPVSLPETSLELSGGLARRRSSKGFITRGPMSRDQLAALLSAGLHGYPSDVGAEGPSRHTALFCAVHDVTGVADGVYFLDPQRRCLQQVRVGDVRHELQAAVTSSTFNVHHVNVNLFPVAHYEPRLAVYGDRWYRVQNMDAGVLVQRLHLAAATLGLGCHTQLGFRVEQVDALLGLAGNGLTSLVHVLVAPARTSGACYEVMI